MRFLPLIGLLLAAGEGLACPIGQEVAGLSALYGSLAEQIRSPRARSYGDELYSLRLRDVLEGKVEAHPDFPVPQFLTDVLNQVPSMKKLGPAYEYRLALVGTTAVRLSLSRIWDLHDRVLDQGILSRDRFREVVDAFNLIEEFFRLDPEGKQPSKLLAAGRVIESIWRESVSVISESSETENPTARRYLVGLFAIREAAVESSMIVQPFRGEGDLPGAEIPLQQFSVQLRSPQETDVSFASFMTVRALVSIGGLDAHLATYHVESRDQYNDVYSDTVTPINHLGVVRSSPNRPPPIAEVPGGREFVRIWWLMVQARMAFRPK